MRSHAKALPREPIVRQADTTRYSLGLPVGLAALLALLAVCAFPSTGLAAGTPVFESAFGPDGTETSQFGAPGAIGVDESTHSVYVADYANGTIEKFDEDGTPTDFSALGENKISGFTFSFGEPFAVGLNQIAVDQKSHDFYVAEYETGKVRAFHPDGTPAGEISGFSEACGVAVDAEGNIYVGEYTAQEVQVFEADGTPLNSFTAAEPCNVAVDSTGVVYVNHYPEEGNPGIDRFVPSEFPITGSTTYSTPTLVDSNDSLALAVDPVSHELFADEISEIAQYDEAGTRQGEFGSLILSEGVAVDGSTGKVYVTDTEGARRVQIFGPPPPVPPTVDSTSFVSATATEAELRAQVNPNGLLTHYRFQYVTQAQFEASGFSGAAESTEGSLPGVLTDQTATGHIGGLTPDTTYRFRVVAENAGGSSQTPEPAPAFTTFVTPPPGLPDGRAYEMVSPPQKLGEVLPPEPNRNGSCPFECLPGGNLQLMPMQSTDDGNDIVYTGQPFTAGLAAAPNEYRSSRTAAGWATQSVSPLLSKIGVGQGYKDFSANLSRAVIYQGAPLGLTSAAPKDAEGNSYTNLYLREADGGLVPLVGETPPNRTAKPGPNSFNIFYGDANAGTPGVVALSHIVFAADDTLTAEVPGIAPAAPAVGASECRFSAQHCNLYEWSSGGLRLVSALSETEAATAPVLGGGLLLAGIEIHEGPAVEGAVSEDGSRIFFTDEASGKLYVRVGGINTLEVPSPDTCKESSALSARTCFLIASGDGRKVLLSNGQLRVLNEAGSAYEAGEDLSSGLGGFKGILGSSNDLSRIYFVDTEALTPPGEENENDEHAEAGKFNLYLHEGGTTRFIGSLLSGDGQIFIGGRGDWTPWESGRTAQVGPDGRYVAFMSTAGLTGYDNKGQSGGCGVSAMCFEVFEYDAQTGKLLCASCNPSGARPFGAAKLSLVSTEQSVFAPLPLPGNLAREGEGRLFFESQDVLSPHDTNGVVVDVYEWEPKGVGSCTRAGGCVYLISSGNAANDSLFVNSTPSGDDAFFITRQQLLPQDQDELLDLYDARVGGGFGEASTAPCGGEACKGPLPSEPVQPAVASQSFSGPGNQKPHKHKKKRHRKQKKHKRHAEKRDVKRDRGGSK